MSSTLVPGRSFLRRLASSGPPKFGITTSVRTRWIRSRSRSQISELPGRRLQLIEGAPARLPRDLSGHLDTAEMDWLRSGTRLECAVETPEQLAQRVLT